MSMNSEARKRAEEDFPATAGLAIDELATTALERIIDGATKLDWFALKDHLDDMGLKVVRR